MSRHGSLRVPCDGNAMVGTRHEESVTGGKRKRGGGQGAKAAKSAVAVLGEEVEVVEAGGGREEDLPL